MFDDVLQEVRNWLLKESDNYNDKINFEIVSDTANSLSANIDTERYIGQLNVSMPDFRPYRYVEFYILDTHKNVMQSPAFVYYDKADDSISDIINNLNKGIDFILSET
jgi:hypothetical protein